MEFVLVLVSLVLAAGIAFAIVVLVTGNDPGLVQFGADGAPVTLPADRPLSETDVNRTRFDTGLRGYRTGQVDEAFARVAYDVGFKDELIKVLASEVSALREGRHDEADNLRDVRERALGEHRATPPPDTRRQDEEAHIVDAGPSDPEPEPATTDSDTAGPASDPNGAPAPDEAKRS